MTQFGNPGSWQLALLRHSTQSPATKVEQYGKEDGQASPQLLPMPPVVTLPEVVDPTPAVAEVVPEVPLVPETEPPVVAVVTPPVVVGRRVVPVVACIEVPLLQAASAKPAETRIERTQPIEHSSDDHEGVYGNDGGTPHRTPQPPRRFSPPKRREGQRLACAGRRFDSHWDRSPAWASLKSAHSAMCSRA